MLLEVLKKHYLKIIDTVGDCLYTPPPLYDSCIKMNPASTVVCSDVIMGTSNSELACNKRDGC